MKDRRERDAYRTTDPGGPEADADPVGPRARPFARLVAAAPVVRRPALTRLAVALALSVVVLALLVTGGARAVRSAVDWLHGQPDYRIAFDDIVLVSPPPAWIRSGRKGLLDQVRTRTRQPETLSVLDADLGKLERAFALHSEWVRQVRRIERFYPREEPGRTGATTAESPTARVGLKVFLDYREPVAEAWRTGRTPVVIDRDGIVLPADDLDRAAAGPLVRLVGLGPDRFWGTPEAAEGLTGPDPQVVAAARLAAFLKAHQAASGQADDPNRIDVIHPGDRRGLFIQTASKTPILWGEAPGSEAPGNPSAAEKWTMLRQWLERPDSTPVRYPDYLEFTRHRVRRHGEGGG